MNLRAGFPALLLSAALPLQTATPPASTAPSTSATTTFHSDILHLDYTYSSALVSMGDSMTAGIVQKEKDQTSGVVKQAVSCLTIPLTGLDQAGGFSMVMMLRMDATCMGMPTKPEQLPALTTSMLTKSMARFGEPIVGTAAPYQVGGHNAAALSASVKSEKYGVTFYGAAACTVQGGDAVCWELISNDCSKLPAMMKAPVKFENQPPEALLPEKFAPACS